MLTQIEHRDDSRMRQRSSGARFPIEAIAEFLAVVAGQHSGQDGFYRNHSPHRRIVGAVDTAHRASAHFIDDFVAANRPRSIHYEVAITLAGRIYRIGGQWGQAGVQ